MSLKPPLKDSLDLEELSKSLRKKKCVLMLGPRIATVVEGGKEVPLMEGLALEFARQLDELAAKDAQLSHLFAYDKDEERNLPYVSQLYLRGQKIDNVDLRKKAKQYIEEKSGPETYIPPIYEELAKLPVRVFVNTTPDDFLMRALKKANKTPLGPVNFNFEVTVESGRNEQQTVVDYNKVSVNTPLVFNLFGSIREFNSMVITEADQVKFVRSVLNPSASILPKELLALLSPDNTYLFFGFNLENWQFRLMLSSLGLGEKNRTLSPQTDNYPVTEVTKTYLKHEFNFHFVDTRMAEFAREIGNLASSVGTENVYISYIEGKEDADAVQKILGTFNLFGKRVRIWHRGLVTSGNVEQESQKELEKATIVIPLLSLNYLNDKYINDVEIPLMQTLLDKGQAEITPILLKHCSWDLVDFFAKNPLTRLPNNSAPPVFGGGTNEDQACEHIAYEFRKRFL